MHHHSKGKSGIAKQQQLRYPPRELAALQDPHPPEKRDHHKVHMLRASTTTARSRDRDNSMRTRTSRATLAVSAASTSRRTCSADCHITPQPHYTQSCQLHSACTSKRAKRRTSVARLTTCKPQQRHTPSAKVLACRRPSSKMGSPFPLTSCAIVSATAGLP